MLAINHPKYNEVMRQAVEIAANMEIGSMAGSRVWYDPTRDAIGAVGQKHCYFDDQRLITVAYCQRWPDTKAGRLVEIRENSGSTFTNC